MLNVQQCQRLSVEKMLNMSAAVAAFEEPDEAKSLWKVLVYDKAGQDILAPLVKVRGLRELGVTLHLRLDTERSPVHEVPAVYFIQATEENVRRVARDITSGCYRSFHLNFITAVPRPLLETLAKAVAAARAAPNVERVVDRYLGFVSLSATEMSSNLPWTFHALHSKTQPEEEIERRLQQVTDSLLSLVITLEVVPVIRCPTSEASPANIIGKRLEERIRTLLAQTGGSFAPSALSASSAAPAGAPSAGSMIGRPALIITDREVDLGVMLHHTWAYEPLVHDVFAMKLNRVEVPIATKEGSRSRTYDLDASDLFWSANAAKPFPEVAISVSDELTEFNKRLKELGHSPESLAASSSARPSLDPSGDTTADLSSAINALPEMTERKRSLDMHTTIATALVNEIKRRELDKFFEAEQQLSISVPSSAAASVEQLMDGPGTPEDKARALLCLVLERPQLTEPQLESLKAGLIRAGGPAEPLAFLQKFKAFKTMEKQMRTGATVSTAAAAFDPAGLMAKNPAAAALASSTAAQAAAWGSKLLKGVRNFLPLSQELAICSLVDALLDPRQQGGAPDQRYLTLDPRAVNGVPSAARSTAKHAIVFVVGGANFVESQGLKDLAKTSQRSIIYGGTDFVSPAEFLGELSELGKEVQAE